MKTLHWFLTASAPLIILTASCASGSLSAKAALQSLLTAGCQYWVAPSPEGNDANPGSQAQPWASLEHAAASVPDNSCTVWVRKRHLLWRTEARTPLSNPDDLQSKSAIYGSPRK
jgi:hypothetical protein